MARAATGDLRSKGNMTIWTVTNDDLGDDHAPPL